MRDLFWLTDEQMERLRPFFPKSHDKPRVDDRRVLSGIIFVNRNGLRWRDAPREYDPHKTLYNRWKRWGDMGIFMRMMDGLSATKAEPQTIMIDATYLKAHLTDSSLRSPISNYIEASALLDRLFMAQWLLADLGYDADWFRDALDEKGIRPCIQGKRSQGKQVKYDKRNRIEIRFGRLKDWRRVAPPMTDLRPSSSGYKA